MVALSFSDFVEQMFHANDAVKIKFIFHNYIVRIKKTKKTYNLQLLIFFIFYSVCTNSRFTYVTNQYLYLAHAVI